MGSGVIDAAGPDTNFSSYGYSAKEYSTCMRNKLTKRRTLESRKKTEKEEKR
jgi:hypothetical protein